jgi:zinc protease
MIFRKMKTTTAGIILLAVIILITGCSFEKTIPGQKGISRITLDNGLQVILKENHASPMATSLIFVKAGSKYENRFNNGVTHFLEHLLFDGTATRTQEQIEGGIDKLGGYINAFTNKDFTAYLVLMPKDYIDYGLATQADMLFNSDFPEGKFDKERKIVIEEMKKDYDREGSAAEDFFAEKAMVGTPYARPVIGFESIIANIPRAAIIDYYKRFYAPNNMTILMIGDFEADKMAETVKNIFGQFPRVELPPPPEISYTALQEKEIYKTPANTRSSYIDYSIEAPYYKDSEYYAFNLIEDYLNDKENSPLTQALMAGSSPLATSVSASLVTKEEFSRLDLEIITDKNEMLDSIITITDSIMQSLSNDLPSKELLNGYQVSRRCREIYMSEKLHYYGFVIAPLMAITGWDFFSTFQDHIDSVKINDMQNASHKYLDNLSYIATVTYPASADQMADEFVPSGPTIDEVVDYYKNKTFPKFNLMVGKDFKMPETKEVTSVEKRHSKYLKQIFDNGLTVIVKSNPDSRVFALNVIGENRSATEPQNEIGITDFVNRMIEKGTTTRNAEELSRELSSIGADVTLYDNPWIPYDDRYTTRRFSFMKFETIDQFTEPGIKLFADMIINPAFDSVEVEKVRSSIFGLLGRNSGSTYQMARNEFYGKMFEGTAYSRPIDGTYRTIKSITPEDLWQYHHKMYSPENMIITVGTNYEPEKVMAMLKEAFGTMPATGFKPVEVARPKKIVGIETANAPMDKDQVYIYLGNLLSSATSPEAPVIKVATEILSNRLRQNLREKQGLAYSVGAGAVLDKKFGWLICSMGTGVNNYEKAKDGIIAEIEKMKTDPPTPDELETAVNSIWGSSLTANLSRINQAYYMGVNEYLGLGYDYNDKFIQQIRAVTPEQVINASKLYFDTKNYVLATAGNI